MGDKSWDVENPINSIEGRKREKKKWIKRMMK